MKVDNNKGIDYIEYNHLNLPITIVLESQEYSGRILYSYDATGVKQKKIVEDYTIPSSPSIKETHYVGSFIYEQQENQVPELKFFAHAEGYFEPTETTPSGELEGAYVYQYKDHTSTMLSAGLGNIRLSYKEDRGNLEIVEENNYYPFGLKHKGYNNVLAPLLNKTQLADFKRNEVKKLISINANLVLMAILLYVAAFAISLGPVMWTLLSEIFPSHIKGIAISVVGFFNSLVSYSVTQFFPWELTNFGPTITFVIYTVMSGLSLLFVFKYIFETKGRTLEEIESSIT